MFEVCLLADRPDLVTPLAAAYAGEWPGWYGRPGNSAAADLESRLRRDGLPLGIVAIEAGRAVGAAALVTTAGPIETDLLPWLGGLLVLPDHRRRRIASRLIERAVKEAGRLGYGKLYASTHGAAVLFRALGWRLRETRQTADGTLDLFEISTN